MFKSTLDQQKTKFKKLLPFIGIVSRDNKNRPVELRVPGSNGKSYQVSIKRLMAGETIKLSLTCQCEGNKKSLCYHCEAASAYVLNNAGYSVAWCANYNDAKTLNIMKKGQLVIVESEQSKQFAYVIINRRENK